MSLILDGTNGLSDVDGSAATPAIRGTDTNTGMFFPAADTIAFSEGGTESMRIDSSGNVMIGTTNIAPYSSSKLTVIGGSSPLAISNGDNTGTFLRFDTGAANGIITINANARTGAYPPLAFQTSDTERLRIDASGNFLFSGDPFVYSFAGGTSGQVRSGIKYDGTNTRMEFYTGQSERMRITSGGDLLVGATSSPQASKAFVTQTAASGYTLGLNAVNNGGTYYLVNFFAANTQTGIITSNGTTTSYGTSSDYRLKENIAPMTGALDKVSSLKPVTYKWKADGSDGQGFIAHELQEVVPDAVVGEKDAVDEEGNIKPQGVDTSFLVATLTAAIQELNTDLANTKLLLTEVSNKVEAQAAEIAALKNPPQPVTE